MSRSEQTSRTVAALIQGGYAGGVQALINGVPVPAARREQLEREQLERDRAELSALAPAAEPITDDELAEILGYECGDCGGGPVDQLIAEIKRLREDGPDPHVIVARIERSPWPDMAGEPCQGQGPEAAEWVIWTNTDTGDGFRLACTAHLGEWVEGVGARLWDLPR
jgi:hypothetical protein